MAFDWTDYLNIARDFKTETNGQPKSNLIEAKQRSAVSRAYYAVYHLAENYAKSHLGYTPGSTGPNQRHADVRSVYKSQMANPDHQEVGKLLFQLHKARKDCDYDERDLGNLEALLASTILNAKKIERTLAT